MRDLILPVFIGYDAHHPGKLRVQWQHPDLGRLPENFDKHITLISSLRFEEPQISRIKSLIRSEDDAQALELVLSLAEDNT